MIFYGRVRSTSTDEEGTGVYSTPPRQKRKKINNTIADGATEKELSIRNADYRTNRYMLYISTRNLQFQDSLSSAAL
jgi:hypothetical protein